jgi:hypothetical protein
LMLLRLLPPRILLLRWHRFLSFFRSFYSSSWCSRLSCLLPMPDRETLCFVNISLYETLIPSIPCVWVVFPCSFVFLHGYDGGSPNFDRSSPPVNISSSKVPPGSHSSCRYAEHLSRISDLEGRLSLLKRQAKLL